AVLGTCPPTVARGRGARASLTAIGLACLSAFLFGAMSVGLRVGLNRFPDVEVATVATVAGALAVALVAAAAEAPSRGVHAAAAGGRHTGAAAGMPCLRCDDSPGGTRQPPALARREHDRAACGCGGCLARGRHAAPHGGARAARAAAAGAPSAAAVPLHRRHV